MSLKLQIIKLTILSWLLSFRISWKCNSAVQKTMKFKICVFILKFLTLFCKQDNSQNVLAVFLHVTFHYLLFHSIAPFLPLNYWQFYFESIRIKLEFFCLQPFQGSFFTVARLNRDHFRFAVECFLLKIRRLIWSDCLAGWFRIHFEFVTANIVVKSKRKGQSAKQKVKENAIADTIYSSKIFHNW